MEQRVRGPPARVAIGSIIDGRCLCDWEMLGPKADGVMFGALYLDQFCDFFFFWHSLRACVFTGLVHLLFFFFKSFFVLYCVRSVFSLIYAFSF